MLRKSAISAVAVASSVALLVVGAPTASQAFTQKELTVCWVNDTPSADGVGGPNADLEAVADGPSFKTFSLDNGDCVSWDVQPGQYKMTTEDMPEFIAAMTAVTASCNNADADDDGDFRITINRMGDSYKAFNLAAFENGEITTNVKKNRSTWIVVKAFGVPLIGP